MQSFVEAQAGQNPMLRSRIHLLAVFFGSGCFFT